VNGFVAALQRFGIGRLAAVLGAAIGVAAVLVALALNVGTAPKALLYSNLDLKEAGEVTAALDQAGIKYEAKGDGSTIMVNRDQVASTRLLLAGRGLPTSGSVGYEIFDQQSALGQTEFTQNLNRQRALEGELARTVRSLKGVNSARVHLVLPKRELFEEEAAAPTASIVVGLAGRDLGAEQVRALRNLVSGAVPGLRPDRVTIVDETGKMLAAGSEDQSFMGELAAERKTETEERIRRAVKDVVEGVVGPGKARVQVMADIDLARVTTQEERFDPDGQVVRSTSTTEENSREGSSGPDGQVTASANIPEGQQDAGVGELESSSSGSTQETTNYEISKTVRTEVIEPGAVKRLSVAVAVDGVTTPGADGQTAYAPRSAEEMQRIQQLVRLAVGYDAERGDTVDVVNVRFNRAADAIGGTEAASPLAGFDKNDVMRGVELLVLLVVSVLVLLFVVGPMVKGGKGGARGGAQPLALASTAAGGGATGSTIASSGDGAVAALPAPEADARIDIAKIEGQVKASSVKKVAEFVDKHPDESVAILRNWLHGAS
jgi:flagellar M-ring protein FliF